MERRLYGQQCRDRKKAENCRRQGVDLVVVRYDDTKYRSMLDCLVQDPIIAKKLIRNK